jgi:hypothetical protein
MSTALDRDDVIGREWDFLALDRGGSVALIASAGYGPIPEAVLNRGRPVEALVAMLTTLLPVLGESLDQRGQDRSGNYSDWFEMSRRGLYTYDWHVHGGPYEQVSAPSRPLRADDVGSEIAEVANLLRLPVLFAETGRFSLDEGGTGPPPGSPTPRIIVVHDE